MIMKCKYIIGLVILGLFQNNIYSSALSVRIEIDHTTSADVWIENCEPDQMLLIINANLLKITEKIKERLDAPRGDKLSGGGLTVEYGAEIYFVHYRIIHHSQAPARHGAEKMTKKPKKQ